MSLIGFNGNREQESQSSFCKIFTPIKSVLLQNCTYLVRPSIGVYLFLLLLFASKVIQIDATKIMKLPSETFLSWWLTVSPFLVSVVVRAQGDNATDAIVFTDCDTDTYYSSLGGDPTSWSKEDLRDLLTSTHRRVLPEFPTQDEPLDITAAVIDLWPGTDDPDDSVHLIYRDIDMPQRPANALETWRTERFWPEKRGAARGTPAFTDVHQTAPGDWTVLDDKAKLNTQNPVFFGECGTVNFPEACVSPANDETAADTAQDSKIYFPPANVRGDIARALFYDALRYEQELGLALVDCPPFGETEFGFRSTLLKWHAEDPPSEEEMLRNDNACSRWQGNRNVFIDQPDLATRFFEEQDVVLSGMLQFSNCMAPTQAPTATPNECSAIIPGGITIYALNSENPDQVVFFPVDNIPGEVGSLFLTDNAWTGTEFLDNEGTLEVCAIETLSLLITSVQLLTDTVDTVFNHSQYKIPEGGIEAGQVFGYNADLNTDANKGDWSIVDDSLFDLHPDGDTLLLYCINADDEPHFISGLSFSGSWSPEGLASYNTSESALPARLDPLGSVAVQGYANWLYNGTQQAGRDVLIPSFSNSSNWAGSDLRYQISSAWGQTAMLSTLASLAASFISVWLL